jgi:hypothetical protein
MLRLGLDVDPKPASPFECGAGNSNEEVCGTCLKRNWIGAIRFFCRRLLGSEPRSACWRVLLPLVAYACFLRRLEKLLTKLLADAVHICGIVRQ